MSSTHCFGEPFLSRLDMLARPSQAAILNSNLVSPARSVLFARHRRQRAHRER